MNLDTSISWACTVEEEVVVELVIILNRRLFEVELRDLFIMFLCTDDDNNVKAIVLLIRVISNTNE